MNNRERRYLHLLRAYPKAYRAARGEEILATLMEASPENSGAFAREAVDVVIHGLQIRLGLSAERFAGRVLLLAAAPGVMMAAGFAIVLLVFSEWLPVATHAPIALRFGPFWTIGPVVYLAWMLCAAGALTWPRRQRHFALAGVVITVSAIPVGDAFFARPNLWQLMLLVGLGIPAIVAPVPRGERPRRGLPIGIGLATSVFIGILEASTKPPGAAKWLPWTFWRELQMSREMPYLAAALIAVALAFVVARKVEAAGALVVLAIPWLSVSALYPYGVSAANTIDSVAVVVLVAWLMVQWVIDGRHVAHHVSSV